MSPSHQHLDVGGRLVKVTNLAKVLYPETGTTKGDVIGYYQAVAPWLVPHAAGRPATRKRWPNGVGTPSHPQNAFFHKNLDAKSTPEWVHTFTLSHSDGDNTYPLIDDAATLVWLAQLAALELHVPQWTVLGGEPQRPNRLVLDLDPGAGAGLEQCVEVAHLLREVLDAVGFASVPVTSGSKGIHLYAALEGDMSSDEVSGWARDLARSLETMRPDLVVSDMKKTLREGRVLLDWSQNNAAKTTIAPYSLRGRSRPTVAAPRTWDEVTPDLRQLEFDEVLERLATIGDPFAALTPGAAVSGGPVVDRLTIYRSMRDAGRTPEPVPVRAPEPRPAGHSFVIQEHHARRLHYDFRLEHDGVLVSWAIPKGPPTDPAQNHLAVQTEDHPLEYGSFEGDIPRGEYGGGQVRIWDAGTFELEKWRDGKEVIATLHGRSDGGLGGQPRRFALLHTRLGGDQKNWLIHLMAPAAAVVEGAAVAEGAELPAIAPMLATSGTALDVGDGGWMFEVKWDGYRAVAQVNGALVTLRSRRGLDLTRDFPELAEIGRLLEGHQAVIDGEVVFCDGRGQPSFERLQNRSQHPGEARYIAFDLMHLDGRSLLEEPYTARRQELSALLGAGTPRVQLSTQLGTDAGEALEISAELGLEGVVAKRPDSTYQPGRRTHTWIKIKHVLSQEVVIVGWIPGESARARTIGSLLMAVPDGAGTLTYVGRVGSGFRDRDLADTRLVLSEIEVPTPPVANVPTVDAKNARWVEPVLVGEVSYGVWTDAGRLRMPVWRGWRPDKTPDDVTLPEQVNLSPRRPTPRRRPGR